MDKKEENLALFKYGIIAPVIHMDGAGQGKYFSTLEQKVFDVPHLGPRKYKKATFKTWLYKYRRYGIDGLKSRKRFDKGTSKKIDKNLHQAIEKIISDNNIISMSQIYRTLISQGYIDENDFTSQTLRKYVRTNKLLKTQENQKKRKKFEKEHVNELWMTDFMRGPTINGRKTYLCCIIDDHSRVITGYGWHNNENALCLEKTLKSALLRFGVCKILYCDNGSAYINTNFQMSCAKCGIALIHTRPYDPAAKGKIERFFRTVRQMFIPLIDFKDITLEELNELFRDWIENQYHKTIHSSIDQRPIDRYINDLKKTQIKRLSEEEIKLIFYRTFRRKVKNDSTISLNGKLYEAPAKYIGNYIELRYPSENEDELFIFENDKPVYKLRKINLVENADIHNTPIFSLFEGGKNV